MVTSSESTSLLPRPAQSERETVEKILEGEIMEAQDPDQLELPEKDEVDPLLEQKTILRPEIEDALEQDQPATLSWLQSLQGFVVQYGIVLIAVFLNIYELVLKPKAAEAMNSQSYGYTWKQQMWKPTAKATPEERAQFDKEGAWPMYHEQEPLGSWELKTGNVVSNWTFDNSEIMFWNAVLSIVLGLVLAAYNRKLGFLFSKESAKMCLIFQPAAIGFALSQFLGFFNLKFLAADVMKVLDQSRLLVTAVVMMFLLRKSYSRATWNSLIVITLAAVIYGNVNTLVAAGSAGSGSPNLPVGMIFVLVNATVTALAGVWAEKYMKAYKSTPFYIQKLYLEVGNMFVQLIFLYVANPLVNSDKANIMTKLGFNPASGLFSNPYMMPLLWVFFVKNYMQGILVKRMSSLVKQLSAVVATALCYFFLIIHNTGCTPVNIAKYTPSEPWKNDVSNAHFDSFSKKYDSKFDDTDLGLDDNIDARRNQWLVQLQNIQDEKVPVAVNGYQEGVETAWGHKPSKATMTLDSTILKDVDKHSNVVSGTIKFFCLEKSLNMYIVLADLLVLFAVVSYIFSNRDKTRKTMYRKERDAAQGVKVVA